MIDHDRDAVPKDAGLDAGEGLRIMKSQRMGGKNVWSIVLAGGEETSPAIRASMAGPQSSKQYCAFVGSRSMFEHTVDRAARVASLQQTSWWRLVITDVSYRNNCLHVRSAS